MPTSRISARLLAGALPGLQQGAQSFGMGGNAREQGFEQGATLQSKLAQALASTRLANAKADEAEREAAFQSPEAIQNSALTSAGIPLDAAPAASSYLRAGKLPAQYDALPADQEGPVLPRPAWEANLGAFARQLATTQNALAVGDKSVSSIAKAVESNREMSLGDRIIAGQIDPMKVSQSQFALKGTSPFHFAEYGVGNNLTGAVDGSGGVAQLFAKNRQAEIGAREAQAGASRASAASSYASADNSRASAAQKRSETERGMKSGDIVVQQAADGTIMLVNKLNGLARPATLADGASMAGKMPAPKEASEGERNAAGYADRMIAAESTMGTKAKIAGAQTPGYIERAIGSNNTISNMVQSADRQQYRQAQEDWVRAKLRKESGAVIGEDEMAREISVYFPQIGDSDAVIKQKSESRKTAENSMRKSAGRAKVDEPKASADGGQVRRFNPATGRIE